MKTLVIIICQTRGYSTTWKTFKENVIDTLDADLALCVSKSKSSDLFREHADYIWEYDDFEDWSTAYDLVQKEINSTENWRSVLDIDIGRDSCLFGGIKHKHTVGSGAVLFYYRWRVLNNIKKHGLLSKYDWFILTRSDYYYPVKHVPVSMLSSDSVWIPDGEWYGGVTDRHIICPKQYIEKSIDMLQYILSEPKHFLENYKNFLRYTATPAQIGIHRYLKNTYMPIKRSGYKNANPETFIDYYLKKQNIPIQFVPYFMYVIREFDEVVNPTAYGNAGRIAFNDRSYSIKYPNEKIEADKLNINNEECWRKYLK